MLYEIFYSNGGHSGGYASKLSAKMSALRQLSGDRTMDWVDIKTSSIRGETIARITREHLCMVTDELGKKIPETTAKNNVAIFTVEARVILAGVTGAELENSEVLHSDVLQKLKGDLAKVTVTNVEIILDEVYEVKDGDMQRK